MPHLDGAVVEFKDGHALTSQSASCLCFFQQEELALVIEAQRTADTARLLPREDVI